MTRSGVDWLPPAHAAFARFVEREAERDAWPDLLWVALPWVPEMEGWLADMNPKGLRHWCRGHPARPAMVAVFSHCEDADRFRRHFSPL